VRALWRGVAELAARSTGGPLSSWQVLELVVAEVSSTIELEPEATADSVPFGNAREAVALDTGNARSGVTRDGEIESLLPSVQTTRCARSAPAGLSAAAMAGLRQSLEKRNSSGGPERLSEHEIDVMATLISDSVESDEAFGCQAPEEIDRRLQDTIRSLQNIDWQLGTLLDTFVRLRLYHNLGYSTISDYVEARLSISPSKVRALVRIAGGRRPAGEVLSKAAADSLRRVRARVGRPGVSNNCPSPARRSSVGRRYSRSNSFVAIDAAASGRHEIGVLRR
jgi:hypothetical protein